MRLLAVEKDEKLGHCLLVAGADLMDGTPIFDIKPYVPYADCHTDAAVGFAPDPGRKLRVEFSGDTLAAVPEDKRSALSGVLSADPRPSYQKDAQRIYNLDFAGMSVKFTVDDNTLTVREVGGIK